jgi:hypothetical protein
MCLLWILYMYTVPRGGTGLVSLLWFEAQGEYVNKYFQSRSLLFSL